MARMRIQLLRVLEGKFRRRPPMQERKILLRICRKPVAGRHGFDRRRQRIAVVASHTLTDENRVGLLVPQEMDICGQADSTGLLGISDYVKSDVVICRRIMLRVLAILIAAMGNIFAMDNNDRAFLACSCGNSFGQLFRDCPHRLRRP